MENSSDVPLPAPPDELQVETQRKPTRRRRSSKQSAVSQMSQGSLDPSKVQPATCKEGSATGIDASSLPKARPRNKSNKRTARGAQGSVESGLSMASSEVHRRTRTVAKTPTDAGTSLAVESVTSLPTRGPAAPPTPPSGARPAGRQPLAPEDNLEYTLVTTQPPDIAFEDDTAVVKGSRNKPYVHRGRRTRPPRLNHLDPLVEVTSIDTFASNDSALKPALKTRNSSGGSSGGPSGAQRIRFQNAQIFSPPESLINLVAQGVGRPRPTTTSTAATKLMNTAPRRKEGSIVWVMGPEGSGKTMLCSSLRKEITQRAAAEVEVLHWPMLLRPRGATAGSGFSAPPLLADIYAVPDVRTADAIVALCASEEVLLKRTEMAIREELVLQLQERLLDHLKNSEAVLNRFADLVIKVNAEDPLTVMTSKTHRQLLERGLIPPVVRRR